ncbi:MAG: hypothetical protein WC728_00700 [Elusimicrobiota bacterium]
MDIRKKILGGLLVSMGLYSIANAVRYVGSLSARDTENLLSVMEGSQTPIQLCGGSVLSSRGELGKTA